MIFYTVYIDKMKCNNASVKFIFQQFERGIKRRKVSSRENCNVTVISAFYELKGTRKPIPHNHLVIRRFESHLKAVVAGDMLSQHKCDRIKCFPSSGQFTPDSALSLAVSSRLIFH